MSDEEVRAQRRSECVQEAVMVGLQYGTIGLFAGIAAVALASRASSSFQKLNTSAKTAIVRLYGYLMLGICTDGLFPTGQLPLQDKSAYCDSATRSNAIPTMQYLTAYLCTGCIPKRVHVCSCGRATTHGLHAQQNGCTEGQHVAVG